MPRKPTGRPTGRPKKIVEPSVNSNIPTPVNSNDSTDVATPALAPAHAPGSQEIIDALTAELTSLDRGTFKASQDFDTRSKNIQFAIAAHERTRDAQAKAEGPTYRATVSHIAGLLREVVKEASALLKDNERLSDENAKLAPSAKLWDAQVSRLADEAKVNAERIAAEEAEAKEQKRREDFLAKYQALVDQDVKNAQAEESNEEFHRGDVRGNYQQFGQPGCDTYNQHQEELTKRAKHLRYLAYAQRLVSEKDFTFEQAKASEDNFVNDAEAKARQAAGEELTRRHMEPEFSPDLDYVPPPSNPNQSDHAPTRGQKVYAYGYPDKLAREKGFLK